MATPTNGNLVLPSSTLNVYAGRLAPSLLEFFRSSIGVLALGSTSYYAHWPEAVAAVSYSYSLNGGSSWNTTGHDVYVSVTGRTAGTTDTILVRAYDVSGNFVEMSRTITLKNVGAPTVIVSVIGTGVNPFTGGSCDYASPDQWENALSLLAGGNNLVTANLVLEGWLLNQEYVNTPCSIEGAVTNANCYRHLTSAPGCSFVDRSDRETSPLRYNASRGSAMRYGSVSATPTVDLREGYSKVTRIQIASTGNGTTTYGGWGIHTSSPSAPVYVDQCLVQSGTDEFVLSANYFAHQITNSIFVNVRPLAATPTIKNIAEENNGVEHTNCIFIALGQTPIVATVARTSSSKFTRCAFFGATYLHNIQNGGVPGATAGTGVPQYTTCFTDTNQSVDISGNVVGLPAGVTQVSLSGLFESTTNGMGNYDLRPQSASALLAANVTGCW